MKITYGGTVYRMGTVGKPRKITPWSVATVEKCKLIRPDGTQKIYYEACVDGDLEGGEMTLKQAKAYIQELVDSWLENHPGETL